MPFQDTGPTVPILPLGSLELGQNGSTPAIQALQNAFASGAIDFETINKHFGDAPRMQAEALINQAKSEQAKGDIAIQPVKNELSQITGDIAIGQGRNTLAMQPQINSIEQAKADAATRRIDQLNQAGNLPGNLRESAQYWFDHDLGPLPMKNGTLDVDTLQSGVERVREGKIDSAAGGAAKAHEAAVYKEAVDSHIDTTGLTLPQIEAKLAQIPGKETADTDMGGLKLIRQVDATQPDINLARQYVNDARNVPVGPGIGEGSKVNQWWTKLRAAWGFANDKYVEQNELENRLANGVLDSIRALAGSGAGRIMASEVDKMASAQPKIESDKTTWLRWLDKAENLLKAARSDSLSRLSPTAKNQLYNNPTIPTNSDPDKVPPAPGTPAPAAAPVDPRVAPLISQGRDVKTSMDYAKIPPGQPYVFQGEVRTKPQ